MSDTVKINIDGAEYEVEAGANLVDAAKWHAGNDIPVFCYHPKMEPVGMCRMCLVELGTPAATALPAKSSSTTTARRRFAISPSCRRLAPQSSATACISRPRRKK